MFEKIISDRTAVLERFLGYIMEENIPLMNQDFGNLEVIMTYLNEQLKNKKREIFEIKQALNALLFEEMELRSELNNFKSVKSTAKTVGANVRDLPK